MSNKIINMEVLSKEKLALYHDNLKKIIPNINDIENLKDKSLSCLTTNLIESFGNYVQDVIYYKSHIIYTTNTSNSLFVYNPLGKLIEFTDCFLNYGDNIIHAIQIQEESGTSNFFATTLTQENNLLTITTTILETDENGYVIPYDYKTLEYYNFTLEPNIKILPNLGFFSNYSKAWIPAINTISNNYIVLKAMFTTGVSSINKIFGENPTPFHVKQDVFDLNNFYMFYNNKIVKISAELEKQIEIELPYSITTNGFIDYFNKYIVYTENGIDFYITDINTEPSTNQIQCTDEIQLFESSDIDVLKIKKNTLKGEVQFYLGLKKGRHIKFYTDVKTYVKVDYNYIDTNAKNIIKIEADPFKNTENILIVYNSMGSQMRILNENINQSGGPILSTMQDSILKHTKEIQGIDDKFSNYQTTAMADYQYSHLENIININTTNLSDQLNKTYLDKGMFPNTNSLNNYKTNGIYAVIGSTTAPSDLPLGRAVNEKIYCTVVNSSLAGSDCVQTLYYTKLKKTFIRYFTSDGSVWSTWTELGSGGLTFSTDISYEVITG